MNEIQREIREGLERIQPGDRVSFGPYTFAEFIDGYEPSPMNGCFARIADAMRADIAASCQMGHTSEVGESESATGTAYAQMRADWEADLAALVERLENA